MGAEQRIERSASDGAAPVIGLALGAGGARGWSHIGVLEALEALGVRPSIVVGCSSGAVVGAAYAAGRLEEMRGFVEQLTWRGMLGYLDFSWRGGGLIEGRWLTDFLSRTIGDLDIADLPLAYGAVATELGSGRETWLTSGSLIDAVRASITLPGLMAPINIQGAWMVDGALVNPIPVSLCRALGAQIIIGVSMSGDLVTLGPSAATPTMTAAEAREPVERAVVAEPTNPAPSTQSSWMAWLRGAGDWSGYWARSTRSAAAGPTPPPPAGRPGYLDVVGQSFFSVQNFISRVRLAADPVDLLIVPDVAGVGVMDFHQGGKAIAAGRIAVESQAAALQALCAPMLAPGVGAGPALAASAEGPEPGPGGAAPPSKLR